jgi:protein-S-isoprenylcysteine O-methyltransferase Ste14
MFTRYFLPLYLFVYVLAAFVCRTYQVWKRTGVNPVTFKWSDSAHDFIGLLFKLLFALIFGVIAVHSLSATYYEYLLPVGWLEKEWLRLVGIGLLLLSLVWTVVAQAQMGDSWRIGIDAENETKLVDSGVYRLSRNPIYLGMMLTLLGLFLIIPNALTLLSLVMGTVLMGVQIRLEEEFLARAQGAEYQRYLQSVRRWFGRRSK